MNNTASENENIKRAATPEDLGDYIQVTSPSVWIVLAAIIILLVSLFSWSAVTAIESFAAGEAEVRDGVLTLRFDDAEKGENVEVGMDVRIGEITTPVLSVGTDEEGAVLAIADADLPDGNYEARVGYKSTQIISMLFN